MSIQIRKMRSDEWDQVAKLIHDSTNTWYTKKGLPPIFQCGTENVRLFCEVYETLDPNCCLVAEVTATNQLAGSCFFHPRRSHYSLGIMNVHPDYFGQGVARRLLKCVTDQADAEALPTRLVSSALNLDSFSLYNRAGFVPRAAFQDMLISVPEDGSRGFEISTSPTTIVSESRPDDLPQAAELERQLVGLQRLQDLEFFHRNALGIWHLSIAKNQAGEVTGYMASVRHPASNMVGPGVAVDAETAIALIHAELNQHAGNTAVVLVPADQPEVVNALYRWGARNCELHFAQVRGDSPVSKGITIPSFMPETG